MKSLIPFIARKRFSYKACVIQLGSGDLSQPLSSKEFIIQSRSGEVVEPEEPLPKAFAVHKHWFKQQNLLSIAESFGK